MIRREAVLNGPATRVSIGGRCLDRAVSLGIYCTTYVQIAYACDLHMEQFDPPFCIAELYSVIEWNFCRRRRISDIFSRGTYLI
jgi:hypothetical protein